VELHKPKVHPLTRLSDDDLELVMQLVLHGGSLKGVGEHFKVSYPTVRGRLNKVIVRLEAIRAGHRPDPLTELLGELVDRSELTLAQAKRIRAAAVQSAQQ